jgi:SAM-dependent methyltransferase
VIPEFLTDLLEPGHELRPVEQGVWSALGGEARYDRRAAGYDFVVGSRLYNRLFWGSSPATYAAFARRATASATGPLLDAACGSLVFSADAYADTARPLILVDLSLGMLRAARARLAARGRPSDRLALVQADIHRLPFRRASFPTVMCMGAVHLFDDLAPLMSSLRRVVSGDGRLFLTSLVRHRWIGRSYLRALHAAGEVGSPRSKDELITAIQKAGTPPPIESSIEGSMAFIVV